MPSARESRLSPRSKTEKNAVVLPSCKTPADFRHERMDHPLSSLCSTANRLGNGVKAPSKIPRRGGSAVNSMKAHDDAMPERQKHPSEADTLMKNFPVVCVGGSAGDLDAYIRLLTHLPADMGVAIVIVNHITAMPTQLHEVLPRFSRMPVELITEDLPLPAATSILSCRQKTLRQSLCESLVKRVRPPPPPRQQWLRHEGSRSNPSGCTAARRVLVFC